jgi:energy-coupling factor transporter ATP-binding protein EcfA2
MIKLRNVEKAVKQGSGQLFLLRRIDLDIAERDFVTVMGPSGAGKSTLLAALARGGADVYSDDLVVESAAGVQAGPRTIDLRAGAAEGLGLAGDVIAARGGSRRRLPLPAAPAPRPMAGWIDLAWAPTVALRRMDPAERLRRLARRRTFPAKLPIGHTLLEMVALPGYVLTRPRRFDAVPETVAAVRDLVGLAGRDLRASGPAPMAGVSASPGA